METLAKTINPIIWGKAQSYAQENGIDLLNYIEKQLTSLYIQEEFFLKKEKIEISMFFWIVLQVFYPK